VRSKARGLVCLSPTLHEEPKLAAGSFKAATHFMSCFRLAHESHAQNGIPSKAARSRFTSYPDPLSPSCQLRPQSFWRNKIYVMYGKNIRMRVKFSAFTSFFFLFFGAEAKLIPKNGTLNLKKIVLKIEPLTQCFRRTEQLIGCLQEKFSRQGGFPCGSV
jgi:hypothetical protein